MYRVAQKVSHYEWSKIVLNRIKACKCQLKAWIKNIILFVGIRYSKRDLHSDLDSLTMPDPQTNDMRQKREMMSTLPLASAGLSKMWILCLNDLLYGVGDICKNISYFHISLFCWVSNMILSDALILLVSQLQTQQAITSQIRSHIEYLIQTYYFFCSFYSLFKK